MRQYGSALRILVFLRGAIPAVFYLIPFLIGQAAAYAGGVASLVAASGACGVWFFAPRAFSMLSAPLLTGVATMLFSAPLPAHDVSSERTYIAQLEGEPRYYSPGAQSINVRVLGALDSKHATIKSFKISLVARCTLRHLPWRNGARLRDGQQVVIRGSFSYDHSRNELRCRVQSLATLSPEANFSDTMRTAIRDRIEGVLGVGEGSGLLLAMTFGFRDAVSRSTEESFRSVGLAHLLVVSGYQVTMIYYCLYWLLRTVAVRLRIGLRSGRLRRALPFVCAGAAGCFVMVVGIDAPGLRAAIALWIAVLVMQLERRSSSLNSIAATAIVLFAIWPGSWLEASVQLTFAALLGLSLGGLVRWRWAASLLSCFAATIFAGAVAALWFDEWNLFALVANPLVAPIVSLVSCPLGLAALTLHWAGLDAEGWCLSLVGVVLLWVRDCVAVAAQWPTVRVNAPFSAALAVALGCSGAWVALRSLIRSRGVVVSWK